MRDISTVRETLEVKEEKVDRKKTNNSLEAIKHEAIKMSICSIMFFQNAGSVNHLRMNLM